MDDRERRRLQMTSDVVKLLKNRGLREALPPLRPDGTAPFIVGLPDDTLHDVSIKVATLGGDAHLIMPTISTSGPVRLQILRVSESGHKPITDLDDSRECAVGEDSTLAMLMQHIEVGQELTYHTYDSETVIRFINDSLQPVPI